MKLWVVFCWAAYEGEWGHTYFRTEEKAREFYWDARHAGEFSQWDIAEIETED